MDIRWKSPFKRSISYRLFSKHFTELNRMYWANIPAANTIKKRASEFSQEGNDNMLDFFIVNDEDDRKVEKNFENWKKQFSDFLNFTRLSMVLSVNSCFEIYLRCIVSISVESKPGVILGDANTIDGAVLLKRKKEYSAFNEKTYPFHREVLSITKGDWISRAAAYNGLFHSIPESFESNVEDLNKLRKLRNDIAHYFAREKGKYGAPITFTAEESARVSHERLLKFFALIYEVATGIDEHLYKDFIGSYEMLKYYLKYKTTVVDGMGVGNQAKWLQKHVGRSSGETVGTDYYKTLLQYFNGL